MYWPNFINKIWRLTLYIIKHSTNSSGSKSYLQIVHCHLFSYTSYIMYKQKKEGIYKDSNHLYYPMSYSYFFKEIFWSIK